MQTPQAGLSLLAGCSRPCGPVSLVNVMMTGLFLKCRPVYRAGCSAVRAGCLVLPKVKNKAGWSLKFRPVYCAGCSALRAGCLVLPKVREKNE